MNLDTTVVLGVIFFMLYSSVLFLLVFLSKAKETKSDPTPKKMSLVSIVIPIYKGDKKELITRAVDSALALDYPETEVILSWNGPKNENYELCEQLEKKRNVKLFYTPKKGKAAGINNALAEVRGEYFSCLDADSFYHKNALKCMVGYLEQPNVAAATSAMKAHGSKSIIQKIQWVEYIFAIYLRKMMSFLNCLYVVPGPGSMYKTEIIRKIGGFDEENLTEDMEIAFRIQKEGYKIANSANAYVETDTPEKLADLVKQRVRWFVGFLDNVKKYKMFVLNPRYGSLGMYMIPASIVWIGVLFYTIGKFFYNVIDGMRFSIKTFLLTGFNLDIFLKHIIDSLYFQPTVMTWFVAVLFIIGVSAILISLWLSNEKVDLRKKYAHYAAFLLVYPFLMALFWASSLTYIAMRIITNTKMEW